MFLLFVTFLLPALPSSPSRALYPKCVSDLHGLRRELLSGSCPCGLPALGPLFASSLPFGCSFAGALHALRLRELRILSPAPCPSPFRGLLALCGLPVLCGSCLLRAVPRLVASLPFAAPCPWANPCGLLALRLRAPRGLPGPSFAGSCGLCLFDLLFGLCLRAACPLRVSCPWRDSCVTRAPLRSRSLCLSLFPRIGRCPTQASRESPFFSGLLALSRCSAPRKLPAWRLLADCPSSLAFFVFFFFPCPFSFLGHSFSGPSFFKPLTLFVDPLRFL